jgi:hypothetical protein
LSYSFEDRLRSIGCEGLRGWRQRDDDLSRAAFRRLTGETTGSEELAAGADWVRLGTLFEES